MRPHLPLTEAALRRHDHNMLVKEQLQLRKPMPRVGGGRPLASPAVAAVAVANSGPQAHRARALTGRMRPIADVAVWDRHCAGRRLDRALARPSMLRALRRWRAATSHVRPAPAAQSSYEHTEQKDWQGQSRWQQVQAKTQAHAVSWRARQRYRRSSEPDPRLSSRSVSGCSEGVASSLDSVGSGSVRQMVQKLERRVSILATDPLQRLQPTLTCNGGTPGISLDTIEKHLKHRDSETALLSVPAALVHKDSSANYTPMTCSAATVLQHDLGADHWRAMLAVQGAVGQAREARAAAMLAAASAVGAAQLVAAVQQQQRYDKAELSRVTQAAAVEVSVLEARVQKARDDARGADRTRARAVVGQRKVMAALAGQQHVHRAELRELNRARERTRVAAEVVARVTVHAAVRVMCLEQADELEVAAQRELRLCGALDVALSRARAAGIASAAARDAVTAAHAAELRVSALCADTAARRHAQHLAVMSAQSEAKAVEAAVQTVRAQAEAEFKVQLDAVHADAEAQRLLQQSITGKQLQDLELDHAQQLKTALAKASAETREHAAATMESAVAACETEVRDALMIKHADNLARIEAAHVAALAAERRERCTLSERLEAAVEAETEARLDLARERAHLLAARDQADKLRAHASSVDHSMQTMMAERTAALQSAQDAGEAKALQTARVNARAELQAKHVRELDHVRESCAEERRKVEIDARERVRTEFEAKTRAAVEKALREQAEQARLQTQQAVMASRAELEAANAQQMQHMRIRATEELERAKVLAREQALGEAKAETQAAVQEAVREHADKSRLQIEEAEAAMVAVRLELQASEQARAELDSLRHAEAQARMDEDRRHMENAQKHAAAEACREAQLEEARHAATLRAEALARELAIAKRVVFDAEQQHKQDLEAQRAGAENERHDALRAQQQAYKRELEQVKKAAEQAAEENIRVAVNATKVEEAAGRDIALRTACMAAHARALAAAAAAAASRDATAAAHAAELSSHALQATNTAKRHKRSISLEQQAAVALAHTLARSQAEAEAKLEAQAHTHSQALALARVQAQADAGKWQQKAHAELRTALAKQAHESDAHTSAAVDAALKTQESEWKEKIAAMNASCAAQLECMRREAACAAHKQKLAHAQELETVRRNEKAAAQKDIIKATQTAARETKCKEAVVHRNELLCVQSAADARARAQVVAAMSCRDAMAAAHAAELAIQALVANTAADDQALQHKQVLQATTLAKAEELRRNVHAAVTKAVGEKEKELAQTKLTLVVACTAARAETARLRSRLAQKKKLQKKQLTAVEQDVVSIHDRERAEIQRRAHRLLHLADDERTPEQPSMRTPSQARSLAQVTCASLTPSNQAIARTRSAAKVMTRAVSELEGELARERHHRRSLLRGLDEIRGEIDRFALADDDDIADDR